MQLVSDTFLNKLKDCLQSEPPSHNWPKDARYQVCGEVLGPEDLKTLIGVAWLNDKVICSSRVQITP
jgi:hypothetical protein